MIITCPQCSSRYLLSAYALAPEGRKVKCSGCGEVWHQNPDHDELRPAPSEKPESFKESLGHLGHTELEFRDIPESVKPLRDLPPLSSAPKKGNPRLSPIQSGYATALAVFCLLSGLMVMQRQAIVDRWLPSAALFDAAGLSFTVPGEGLMFDVVSVTTEKKDNAEIFNIEGRILNITPRSLNVPYLYADIRDADGELISQINIPLEQKTIDTGQSLDFSTRAELPASLSASVTASEVRVHLSLLPDTKS
jgi:predicted Zn finger-like uncharacterized protein